ncbi:DNA polymerase processivity factor [Serratia phage phiMAM1]|uniref:Sliding clamp n=2 Tax=Miltonvirus MAM1 TaxID=2169689 RepID=K7YIT2_9CAUD|nr:DNA polymerase processivity factor [Serratia phage phiMAM1]AFX93546.1 sliding clamp protein [Serratia phage phiMAM1]ASZ78851.1 sliding clamp protein [Serratia phage 2050H1]
MSSIKLSERTSVLLANAATISPSIVLQPGKFLRTISDSSSILMIAQIEEEFPHEFPILDISKLLSILKLKNFKTCDLDFTTDKVVLKGDKVEATFWRSAKELTTLPPDGLVLENQDYQAEISHDQLSEFIRACSVLGHKIAKLVNSGGKSYLVGTNPEIDNSNDYTLELGETDMGDCSLMVEVGNLKVVEGNYTIKAYAETQVINLVSADASINYYIGMHLD